MLNVNLALSFQLFQISRMNPLLWLLFMTIFWIFCNFKKIKEAILERRHILDCLEKIPGPYAFPLIGIAYKLSADSVSKLSTLL